MSGAVWAWENTRTVSGCDAKAEHNEFKQPSFQKFIFITILHIPLKIKLHETYHIFLILPDLVMYELFLKRQWLVG